MPDTEADRYPLDILIVEDDPDARASLKDILELEEHHVIAVANADAALDEMHDLSGLDVIMLDRKLPDGLAEELLPTFRQNAPSAEVIVVTGFADLESTIAAFREGATDYIIKPINPGALLASLRRVGKRRQIERQLRKERQFAELILETAEAIILVLDIDGRIVRFNPYLTELTGYTLEDAVGKSWFDVFLPNRERDRIENVFSSTLVGSSTHGVANAILTKDGQERVIRWSNTVLKDDANCTTGILAVGLDVTDLAEAQHRLLQSERLATIGQTMTGLAHESRNALQRLQNAVELLEDEIQDNPMALKDLAKIERASNDLRDLLEEVRSYAAPIHLDRFDSTLPPIWRRAWNDLAVKRGSRDAQLVEGPSPGEDVSIKIDTRRLEQVFRNLFENALDACPDPVRIELDHAHRAQLVEINIQDNGPGIPEAKRAKAFDPFFTTKPTGTGLGLSIVHRLVEAHGGTIEIVPTNQGTKFRIRLPLDS